MQHVVYCHFIIAEPFGPRARIVDIGQGKSSAEGILTVSTSAGAPGPTFSCFVSTLVTTVFAWQKVTGDREIPLGVTQQLAERSGFKALNLVWNRAVQLSDNSTYICQSSSYLGTSNATLDFIVPGKLTELEMNKGPNEHLPCALLTLATPCPH